MKAEQGDEKLQEIITRITKTARADGKITKEEKEILEAVQINVMVYDQALDDALEDGIITQKEKETLVALKQQILNEAYQIAEVSEGVSDDEIKMLKVLLQELEKEE